MSLTTPSDPAGTTNSTISVESTEQATITTIRARRRFINTRTKFGQWLKRAGRVWRQWSTAERVLGSLIVLAVAGIVLDIVIAIGQTPDAAVKSSLPVLAALIAVTSLTASAMNAAANYRRQLRDATMAAYSNWSDSTFEDRRSLQALLGDKVITDDLAMQLVAQKRPPKIDQISPRDRGVPGAPTTPVALGPSKPPPKFTRDELQRAANQIINVLNGLERLAVGVELGFYDPVTLRRLAGTIIVRHWERFRPYALARRGMSNPTRRQTVVYIALEELATELSLLRDEEDRHLLDQTRLNALKAPGDP